MGRFGKSYLAAEFIQCVFFKAGDLRLAYADFL
jgi:hypothetical protein